MYICLYFTYIYEKQCNSYERSGGVVEVPADKTYKHTDRHDVMYNACSNSIVSVA